MTSKKSSILIIILIIVIVVAGSIFYISSNSPPVNVYIDGENVTCSIGSVGQDNNKIQSEICDYVLEEMYKQNSNITTLKEGICKICVSNGINDPNIKIDSSLGENGFPAIYEVEGESMVPTLENGQNVVVNKTKNIAVDDIVVANNSEYGVIVKRVSEIDGNQIHLISDNKNVKYEVINGITYETRGIDTWTDLSTIIGIVEEY